MELLNIKNCFRTDRVTKHQSTTNVDLNQRARGKLDGSKDADEFNRLLVRNIALKKLKDICKNEPLLTPEEVR
jgi:hypothetical protein